MIRYMVDDKIFESIDTSLLGEDGVKYIVGDTVYEDYCEAWLANEKMGAFQKEMFETGISVFKYREGDSVGYMAIASEAKCHKDLHRAFLEHKFGSKYAIDEKGGVVQRYEEFLPISEEEVVVVKTATIGHIQRGGRPHIFPEKFIVNGVDVLLYDLLSNELDTRADINIPLYLEACVE